MIITTQSSQPTSGSGLSRYTAGQNNVPGGTFSEAYVSELTPQYYSLMKQGKVFSVASATTTTATAFTGGAAGTPIFGIYNPATSGIDLVLLQARVGVRTTGTTAGTLDYSFWSVNQGGVAVTGTQTQARNMYSQANTGSVAYAMVNTANTAALASTLIAPSVSVGNVTTTAGLNAGLFVDDIKGAIIVAPGTYLAFGASATLAAASIDYSLIWAELSV
jgi:hypothetical protein